jgi:gliding motility-associated-like protein
VPSKSDTVHIYNFPGTYDTYLVAKKYFDLIDDFCYDTFPKKDAPTTDQRQIEVNQVKDSLTIPNVFTPNNANAYPYWRMEDDVSITDFEIAIYNRYGKKVYYFRGNIRDWIGWDGKNDANGKYVSTGVYYYVVKKISPLPDFGTRKLPETVNFTKKGFIHTYTGE